jgi:flagellar basal-body rod protein FlgB
MDLNRLPLFSLISHRMNWLGDRQRVLAQNVANADTPNFQPRDLKPFDARAAVKASDGGAPGIATRMKTLVTNASHLVAASAVKNDQRKIKPLETTLSGNSVSIEQEIMKSADTAMDYQLVTNLYRKQLAMLRNVLSRQT